MWCGHSLGTCAVWVERVFQLRRGFMRLSGYHVSEVMVCTQQTPHESLPREVREKVIKIVDVLGKNAALYRNGRKRMISTKFIVRKLLMELGQPHYHIIMMKTLKARNACEEYCDNVKKIKGDEIMCIVNSWIFCRIPPLPIVDPIPPNAKMLETVWPTNRSILRRPTALLNAQHFLWYVL